MPQHKKTHPRRQAKECALVKELLNDSTIQNAVLIGLAAPAFPLIALLIYGSWRLTA